MGKRKRRLTGMSLAEEKLPSHKLKFFVAEYLVDFNGPRAAMAVGVKKESARVLACKWLRNPAVVAVINEFRKEHKAELQLLKEEWLEQLFFLCTRKASDFVDAKTGELLPLHKLGDRAAACVDGFDVDVYENDKGRSVKTKVKLSPKNAALRLAAESLGVIQPTAKEGEFTINLKALAELLQADMEKPDVESQLKLLEQQALDVSSEEVE